MKIILEEFQKEAAGRGLLLIKQVVDQVHDLMNSVEDGRIENILCRIYPGAKSTGIGTGFPNGRKELYRRRRMRLSISGMSF